MEKLIIFIISIAAIYYLANWFIALIFAMSIITLATVKGGSISDSEAEKLQKKYLDKKKREAQNKEKC